MKFSAPLCFLLLATALQSGVALAERADRDKPMRIEADALRYDDAKQISVFTGKVMLAKGTMLIRGAQMDVRQDPSGNQYGVIKAEPGQLAFFRQKRDSAAGTPDEFMEGEAELIEYDGKADSVKFLRRAVLRRYVGSRVNDEVTGAVIVFDNSTSILTVDGGPVTNVSDPRSGRVRAVLTPRVDDNAVPGTVPPVQSPALRRSGAIGGDKK